jgi:hypothetical protein
VLAIVYSNTGYQIAKATSVPTLSSLLQTSSKYRFPSCQCCHTHPDTFILFCAGHATMGTSTFEVIAAELKLPLTGFTFPFTSAEFDGTARDPGQNAMGAVRPKVTRILSLADCIKENQESRAFLGVHWLFDSTQGGVLGSEVAKRIVAAFPERA